MGGADGNVAELTGLGQAPLFAGVASLANTILGAGVLGLPHAFSECGYVVGTVLLVGSACFSAIGLNLLASSAESVGIFPCSFYTVAQAAVPRFALLIDGAVAIKCFGVATSYLIVIGDVMPKAMVYLGGPQDRRLWVTVGFGVVIPLALQKTLSALRFTSSLSLVFVTWLALLVLLYALPSVEVLDPCEGYNATRPCQGRQGYLSTDVERTLKVFTVFVFAYTCQQNIFSVCNEMRDRSITRVNKVISISIIMAVSIYLLVAVAGFATFGESVQSDLLKNFPETTIATCTRIFIGFLVCFSYPLQVNPSRKSFLSLWRHLAARNAAETQDSGVVPIQNGVQGEHGESDFSYSALPDCASDVLEQKAVLAGARVGADGSGQPLTLGSRASHEGASQHSCWCSVDPGSNLAFYGVTAAFLLLSYGIAMVVDDLGIVLALVGATGSTMVCYILPGAVYWNLHPEPHLKRWFAGLQFVMGCIIVPLALTFIFVGGK